MLKYARILIGLWSRSFGGRRIDDPPLFSFIYYQIKQACCRWSVQQQITEDVKMWLDHR